MAFPGESIFPTEDHGWFNIVLVGDGGIGKTSILLRYGYDNYTGDSYIGEQLSLIVSRSQTLAGKRDTAHITPMGWAFAAEQFCTMPL